MQEVIQISTNRQNGLYDNTQEVEKVSLSGIKSGIVNVYVQGANVGIKIGFSLIGPLLADGGSNLKL